MTGRVAGKVAFITGAARGQGRAHAVRMAEEGADIIALDVAAAVETNIAPAATTDDLAETARAVEALGRRIVTYVADVRDFEKLSECLQQGVSELGRLDIVVANAGLWSYGRADELSSEAWQTVIDVVLTGVWHTTKAATPHLLANGDRGGSMILISSIAGLKGYPNLAHYVAAKHGVSGLAKTLALELAPHNIRVNTVNPSMVNTPLINNQATYDLFAPDLPPNERTLEAILPRFSAQGVMNTPWMEPRDIADAVLWLASDEARWVTGHGLNVDAGKYVK